MITVEVTRRVGQPVRLVELGFSTALRLSTHERIEWDGKVWLPGVDVAQLEATIAAIELRNDDDSAAQLALAHRLPEVRVTIWEYRNGHGIHRFNGLINGCRIGEQRVTFNCARYSGAAHWPRKRIAGPVFNHVTPAGTTIQWVGGTLVLEPETER